MNSWKQFTLATTSGEENYIQPGNALVNPYRLFLAFYVFPVSTFILDNLAAAPSGLTTFFNLM